MNTPRFLTVLLGIIIFASVESAALAQDDIRARREARLQQIEIKKKEEAEGLHRFFLAIEQNEAGQVKAFLDKGYDAALVNQSGTPALLVAARSGNTAVVELLLDAGAAIEQTDGVGDNALMLAAISDRRDTVKTLLKRGARVNRQGWTALHYAATAGNDEIAEILIDYLADMDARAANGITPLMMAARQNQKSTVTLLLRRGADPTIKNDAGDTALIWATRAQHQEIARALREVTNAAQK